MKLHAGNIDSSHFTYATPTLFGLLRMPSLLHQCTEQWHAWVFLWGRFRKPSLEAGCSITISLMPAYNEYPCVRQFGKLSVRWPCDCFRYTDRVLRFVRNSIILWAYSGLCVCLGLCCRVSLCERVGWHVSVCPDIVQQPVTASPLALSCTPSLSGLFCCQWKLMSVMDYSRTDANLSWHSQNSILPYWDQPHRMLSPIVPYSEYTTHFCTSHWAALL